MQCDKSFNSGLWPGSLGRDKVELEQNFASLSVFISFSFVLKVKLKDFKFEFCQFKLESNHR